MAVVEQAGLVRERIVAGRYAAPAPQRPARPKRLALRRRGGALTVRWKRSAGASTHRVQAQLSDGRRLLLEVKGRSLRIPAFGPRETATVSVRGVRGAYVGAGGDEADQAGALSASGPASSASSRRSTERSTGSSAPCRRTSGRSGGS